MFPFSLGARLLPLNWCSRWTEEMGRAFKNGFICKAPLLLEYMVLRPFPLHTIEYSPEKITSSCCYVLISCLMSGEVHQKHCIKFRVQNMIFVEECAKMVMENRDNFYYEWTDTKCLLAIYYLYRKIRKEKRMNNLTVITLI